MTSRVLVALRVKARPERAFGAFVGEIGQWWRPNGLFRTAPASPGILAFDPRPGGALTETAGDGTVFEIGRILDWSPPTRLRFSWRQAEFPPDLATEVEVTFEPTGDETRVTVVHSGFHQVPADSAARHGFPDAALLARLGDWWRLLLDRYGQTASGPPSA